MNKEVEQHLRDECWKQGIEKEARFMLDFCDRRGIKTMRSVTGFVIAWRLNPVRQSIAFWRKIKKKEVLLTAEKRLNERLTSELVTAWEQATGLKCPKLKDVPKKAVSKQRVVIKKQKPAIGSRRWSRERKGDKR